MRISDWSSDVCSSDLRPRRRRLGDTPAHQALRALDLAGRGADGAGRVCHRAGQALPCQAGAASCREGNGGSRMTTTSRRPRLAVVIGTVCFLAFLALLFYGVRQSGRGDREALPSPLIDRPAPDRSEAHTSELQSLMRISYAVFCLKKKNNKAQYQTHTTTEHKH